MDRRAGTGLALLLGLLLASAGSGRRRRMHRLSQRTIDFEALRDVDRALHLWATRYGTLGPSVGELSTHARDAYGHEIPLGVLSAYIFREWSQNESGPFNDIVHGAGFYEIGLGQVPWGQHGTVTGPHVGAGDAGCQYPLPGRNWETSPGGRTARQFYTEDEILSRRLWLDPVVQAASMVQSLERDHAGVRLAFPSLFPASERGNFFDMAIMLLAFSRGANVAVEALQRAAHALDAAQDDGAVRWSIVADTLERMGQTEGANNVSRKLALARMLAARLGDQWP